MRIKKTSQTTPVQAEVVNTYSESQENAYSCDYLNSKVLWTNSNPTSTFTSQSITLSSGDYNYLEIYFRTFTNQDTVKSVKVEKGQNGLLNCAFFIGSKNYLGLRHFTYTDSTHIAFAEGRTVIQDNNLANGVDNSWVIPIKIIGYK